MDEANARKAKEEEQEGRFASLIQQLTPEERNELLRTYITE